MKKRVLWGSIIVIVLICVGTGIYFTLNPINTEKKNDNKKDVNKVSEISTPRLNYMEANYNVMVATSLNSFLEVSSESYEMNKIYKIDANTIAGNHEDIALYDACEGIVEYQPLSDNSYNFTITSNCNDESNKKVTVKGYYNPYDKKDHYVLNYIQATDNGYIGYFDNAYVEVYEDGSHMSFNSYEMLIYYDENLQEVERHYFGNNDKKNLDIALTDDNKYSILNENEEMEEYYITILDYATNDKYEVSTPYNLKYVRSDENNYYYSYWDSIHKLDKNTKEFSLIREESNDGFYRWIYNKNNVTYSYYDVEDIGFGYVQIYDDNFNVQYEIEFEDLDSFIGYANESVAVANTWNEDYSQVIIKDIKTGELLYSITDKELMNKVNNLEYNEKEYSNIVYLDIDVNREGVALMLTIQYYDIETTKMKTDNVIINIDNEGNEEIVNIYQADYTKEVFSIFEDTSKMYFDFGNSYVNNNKYIDFINLRDENELLLYIIYE